MTDLAGDVLDEITLKKEIVYWYLNADKDVISDEVRRVEKKYFDLITGNSGFEFDLVEKTRVGVKNVFFASRNPTTENLLKIPEGIYEAKSASIILAVPQFRTICLDDAERGMHPQMIERLRDLVLQDIDNKVVMVITHHTAFLAPWNISRTFFFQRHLDGDNGYNFAVKPLGRYSEAFGGKGPQIITSGQYASLFFAERICWVEGKTDYLFMTALKYEFLRKESKVLGMFCLEDEQKPFRDFLSTLHIVSMEGEAGKFFFRLICKALELAHLFILDYDALENNIPGEKPDKVRKPDKDILLTFCKAFELEIGDEDLNKIKEKNDSVKFLQQRGIFVWKVSNEKKPSSGSIENAVQRLCERKPALKDSLTLNNVSLSNKGKKDKLFKNKEIQNHHIANVVKELLEHSEKDDSSDFHRLVSFLLVICMDNYEKKKQFTGQHSIEQSRRANGKRKADEPEILNKRDKRD